MKIIIIITLTLLAYYNSPGQGLTQSADGKSTIIFKGSSISLDVEKSDFSIGINNLVQAVKLSKEKDNYKAIYGIDVSAKSEEGLGDLFSKGDLVPSAKGNAFFGISFSNTYIPTYEREKAALDQALADNSSAHAQDFKQRMEQEVDKIPSGIPHSDQLKKQLQSKLKQGNVKRFTDFLATIKADDNDTLYDFVAALKTQAEELEKQYNSDDADIIEDLKDLHKSYTLNNLKILSIYGFGGINAMSFKHFDSVNTNNYSKSFSKEEFSGGNIGIGVNYQVKQWRFGLTYEYNETNNFDMLDKVDYTLSTLNTSGNQSLKQDKAVTAYSGTYGKVVVNKLNADVVYSLRLDKDANNFCFINPYFRSNIFSRDTSLLVNTMNIGAGFYFFDQNSKFLGGLYIELPDVKNNTEKNKPIADQNIRPALKRLTFGIVAKFSISSILKFQ